MSIANHRVNLEPVPSRHRTESPSTQRAIRQSASHALGPAPPGPISIVPLKWRGLHPPRELWGRALDDDSATAPPGAASVAAAASAASAPRGPRLPPRAERAPPPEVGPSIICLNIELSYLFKCMLPRSNLPPLPLSRRRRRHGREPPVPLPPRHTAHLRRREGAGKTGGRKGREGTPPSIIFFGQVDRFPRVV